MTEREELELDRLQAEVNKLTAETKKLLAEANKIRREALFYPFVAVAGLITVIVTAAAFVHRL